MADMKAFRSITVFELMSGWWKRRQAAENKRSDREERLDEVEPKTPSALSAVEVDGAEDGAIEAFTRRANMVRISFCSMSCLLGLSLCFC